MARLPFLVVGLCSRGTTTDTPDVEVDARSILGRSPEVFGVGTAATDSRLAGSTLAKERFANSSLRGYSAPPLLTSRSKATGSVGTSRPWPLAGLFERHWITMCRTSDHKRTLLGTASNFAGWRLSDGRGPQLRVRPV